MGWLAFQTSLSPRSPLAHLALAMREPCRRHASQICQPSKIPCHSGGRALAPRLSASWMEEGANEGVSSSRRLVVPMTGQTGRRARRRGAGSG